MEGHVVAALPVMSILPLFHLEALVLLDLSLTADAALDAGRLQSRAAVYGALPCHRLHARSHVRMISRDYE